MTSSTKSHFIPYCRCTDHGISWDLMGSVPKGEILSHAIFICSCYHYSDLCLTSTYFSTSAFCLPSSVSYLSPNLLDPLPFCLPSSISCLYFNFPLLTSVFCLLSYVPLFCFYYYLSTICPLVLAFPF